MKRWKGPPKLMNKALFCESAQKGDGGEERSSRPVRETLRVQKKKRRMAQLKSLLGK